MSTETTTATDSGRISESFRRKPGDFKVGQRVNYIEFDGAAHRGTVSSINHLYVFVRFDRQVAKLGWSGATSQSCQPNDLYAVVDESTAESIRKVLGL